MAKTCQRPDCTRGTRSDLCLMHRPRKAIATKKRPRQQSDKEKDYQTWLKEVARPAVIARDGEFCRCPNICHNVTMLDLDHVLNKGSHPQLKMSIDNLQLLCRFCHINKTINKPCLH